MSTVALVSATRSIISKTFCMGKLTPMMFSNLYLSLSADLRMVFSRTILFSEYRLRRFALSVSPLGMLSLLRRLK